MTIHILGLGSIGILSAHLLRTAHPHLPIRYLPRRNCGVSAAYTVHHPDGRLTQISDLVNDITGTTPIEVLLVTTKAHHAKLALLPYYERIVKDTLLIFIQNGMGIVDSV